MRELVAVIRTIDPAFVPKGGHIYFVSKDGDLCCRKANPGPVPAGPSVGYPTLMAVRIGINKDPGWIYYYQTKCWHGVEGPKVMRSRFFVHPARPSKPTRADRAARSRRKR